MSSTRRSGAGQGFTLIELLVVIAIIAILAAILFPVFAQAREKARAIDCVSNLKQVSLGMLQYTQDNDEEFPFGTDAVPNEGWNAHNTYRTPNTGEIPPGEASTTLALRSSYFWSNTVQPYIKSLNVYQCKDSHLDVLTGAFADANITSPNVTYTYNGELQCSSQAVILAPSDVPMVWAGELGNALVGYAAASPYLQCANAAQPCVYQPESATGACNTGNGGTSVPLIFAGLPSYKVYVHAVGDNFAYCDGHVKYVNYNITPGTAGAPAGFPLAIADSAGDLILPGGNSYGYYYDGCHVYGFEPDFNP